MAVNIYTVDAFTDEPFSGNPAAVCLLDGPADVGWMQRVALEMNLSETAFLHPQDGVFHLRWFTPKTEVDLCGHATLASAHVLWRSGRLPETAPARFETRSGRLTARCSGDAIEMDFPSTPEQPIRPPGGLDRALGVHPVYVGMSRFDVLVQVSSEAEVRNLKPDMARLQAIEARGCIVTSRSASAEFDFVSRFFAPAAGVNEDPVTGSAHCCLAPFWQKQLNKDRFVAYQASQRGGVLHLRLSGDRVYIGGQAVTIMEGALQVG